MEQFRELAITLRSIPYEDRHRVVTALTESRGKISVLARNAVQSRRFGGTLEPFAAAEWFLAERPGSDLLTLQKAEIRKGFEELRTDFDRMALASFLNELMLQLAPERTPCADLFKLHSNALTRLSEPVAEPRLLLALLNAYMVKVLQWSGHQPQVTRCLGCQTSLDHYEPNEEVSFLILQAAWLCSRCREAHRTAVKPPEGWSGGELRGTALALHDFVIAMTHPLRQAIEMSRASLEEHRTLFRFTEALFVYFVTGFNPSIAKSLRFLGVESIAQPERSRPRSQPLGLA